MLLQTNSYVVPKERRAEHQRLLRRFRQTLARLGCEHFEVYEQVGANWTAGDNTGRYVQIMRFRDRRHQLAVQSAERADPGAQAVIAEFCNLINFPYQQQQGLFAVGFYQSALPVTMRREATRAEVEASDGVAGNEPGEAEEPVEETAQAEAEPAEDEDLAGLAADEAEEAETGEEEAEAEGQFEDEEQLAATDDAGESDDELPEAGEPTAEKSGVAAEIPAQADVDEAEEPVTAEADLDGAEEPVNAETEVDGTQEPLLAEVDEAGEAPAAEFDEAELAESHETSEAVHAPEAETPLAGAPSDAAVALEEEEEAAVPAAPDTVTNALLGAEEAEPLTPAGPATAFGADQADLEAPALADAGGELDGTEAEHAHELTAEAGKLEWATGAEAAAASDALTTAPLDESSGADEAWDQADPAAAVELSAEEGDIEIVFEQLPGASDETEEAAETIDDEGGFDALLSNEQLLEGFDAEDELLHGAAHKAELQAHGASGSRNGNDIHSETSSGRHSRTL